jgi:pyruvate formate lyase activating enzyme
MTRAPAALRVGGVVPFSATDHPGALAAVVFCQGCPWRCGYCQNPHLIPARGAHTQAWPDVRAWLEGRRGLLDAVVFSGGEPTAQPALAGAIGEVRELGFAVGLHTAGAYPRRLAGLLPFVDWVGLDIKAPFSEYEIVTGVSGSGRAALESLEHIQRAGVACELRTTVHPALCPPAALERMARELARRGVRRWVLQPTRAAGRAPSAPLRPAQRAAAVDAAMLVRLREHVGDVEVRG